MIWGWLSGTSTVTLFEAGMIPGIVMGLLMMACVYVMIKVFHIKAPKGRSYTMAEKLKAYKQGLKEKIVKANAELAEVKYKFKVN